MSLTDCSTAYRGISTSFIASDCQGIHRIRLVAQPYNPKVSGETGTAVSQYNKDK